MPKFFLVAPPSRSAADIIAIANVACKTAPCASIIVAETFSQAEIEALQNLGLAVLLSDCEPRMVSRSKADGLHLSELDLPLTEIRKSLPKDAMIGVNCGTSRHLAMEAAEQGADYIAFNQYQQKTGEPLVAWWNNLAEIPAVPFEPVEATTLETLLQQNPDFIRPSDDMWESAESCTAILKSLAK